MDWVNCHLDNYRPPPFHHRTRRHRVCRKRHGQRRRPYPSLRKGWLLHSHLTATPARCSGRRAAIGERFIGNDDRKDSAADSNISGGRLYLHVLCCWIRSSRTEPGSRTISSDLVVACPISDFKW